MTRCAECGLSFTLESGAQKCAELDREIAERRSRIVAKKPQLPDPFLDEKSFGFNKLVAVMEEDASFWEMP